MTTRSDTGRTMRAPGTVGAFAVRLRVQARVLRALVIREMMKRYGRRNIGFLWLVAEPLILTGGIILLWTATGRSTHGVPLIAFALTGYTMLTLWRQSVQSGVNGLRSAAPLFFHQNVRPLDALVSRAVLDVFGALMSFVLAYLMLLATGYVSPIADHFLLVSAWWWMSLFAFGVSLCVAALTERFETAERFIQPMMYLAIPLTGAFTMMSWMPEGARAVLSYSPMIHATEMFRAGFMGEAHLFYYDWSYLAVCTMAIVLVGLVSLHRAARNLRYV